MFRKRPPKILIVEDQHNNYQLYTDVFTDAGFEVQMRQSADGNFVDDVVQFDPVIISMDIDIGVTESPDHRSGLDAVCILKEDERTKHIPIVMLTNFYDDEKVKRAHECGASDYITVQGQELRKIAAQFMSLVKSPKKYMPTHPVFR